MAETKPVPAGPPSFYFKDALGNPVKTTDPAVAEKMSGLGRQAIGVDEAQSLATANRDLAYVDQNWGAAGKFGMGALGGLTLGVGPGILADQGWIDPGHARAAQQSGWYTGGEVAGTLLPALLSGGESIAGRSAVGRALSFTPAGLMDAGGSLAERAVVGALGEEAGFLGRMALTPAKMAARGAFEGAAINLGHVTGDALIDNKPLSAEALLASGLDGALAGGLLGGTLGTVGSIGSRAVDSLGSIGKAAINKSGIREGLAFKRLGMGAEDIANEGGVTAEGRKSILRSYKEAFETGGVKIGDSNEKIIGGMKKAQGVERQAIKDVISELESIAPTDFHPERMQKRVDAALASHLDGLEAGTAKGLADQLKRDLDGMFWERKPDGTFKTRPGTGVNPDGTVYAARERIPKAQTWENWIGEGGVVDQLRARVSDFLNKVDEVNPGRGLRQKIKSQFLDQIESEVAASMEAASPELAAKYAAARTRLQIAQKLEENIGKKTTQDLLKAEPAITARDLGAFVGMAAIGHPLSGLTWLMAKGVGRQLQGRLEPAIAQMAFDASVGTKAAAAAQSVNARMSNSLSSFFKSAGSTPAKVGAVANNKKKGEGLTREKYEEAASRMEQLISQNHQDKVRRYAESLHDMGYAEFAKSIMDANNRAVQYMLWNAQPRESAKGLRTLRPHVTSKVPTLSEHKQYRQFSYISEPFKLLEDLEAGKLSRDGVKAWKYVYPEMHAQFVQQATMKVAEMKQEGKYLPMSKIVNLGIALDAPIDSTLTPEYISNVQMALNTPSQPGPPTQQPTPGPTPMAQSLMTPMQKLGVA